MSITAIIETPRGSAEKYKYDKKMKLFRLDKILPTGMSFPYDFGFIPGTKGEDGDPLDILLISELQAFPGCVVECRVIGAILAVQSDGGEPFRNDRFIAIPEPSLLFKNITSFRDLPEGVIGSGKIFPELQPSAGQRIQCD